MTHSHYGYKLGLDSKKKGATNMNKYDANDYEELNNDAEVDKISRIVVTVDDSEDFEKAVENSTKSMFALGKFLWDRPDVFRQIIKNEVVLSIGFPGADLSDVTDLNMYKIIPAVVEELINDVEGINYEKALAKIEEYVNHNIDENNADGLQNFIRIFLNHIMLYLIDEEKEETEPFEDSTVFKDFINSLGDEDHLV